MEEKFENPFHLLMDKDVYALLDGDRDFGSHDFGNGGVVKNSMPYMTGRMLCKLAGDLDVT